jgi:hypothetical protein
MTPFQRKLLDRCRAAARALGGECLSERYVDGRHRMTFRCAKGHRWRTASAAVTQGQWCPHCAGEKPNEAKRRRKFLSVQRIATNHGGRCLARTYVDQYTKMRWRCAEGHVWIREYLLWSCRQGHEWRAKPNVIINGRWCPELQAPRGKAGTTRPRGDAAVGLSSRGA